MKKTVLILLVGLSGFSYSQIGINTEIPQATLDVVATPADPSKIDGFIAPRLSGDDLAAKDGLYLNPQTGTIIYATAAVGTPTAKTINVTSAGYYYFDGMVWQKINAGTTATEPWFDQSTDAEATTNTQNIYQMGNVAVGKTDNLAGTALDVEGAVRGGANQTGSVGGNSAAFGDGNTASGLNSMAFGADNIAVSEGAVTLGAENEITGVYGQAYGYGNIVSNSSIAIGEQNNIVSTSSLAAGVSNQVEGNNSFVLGEDNTVTSNANFNSVALGGGNLMDNSGYILGQLNQITGFASNSVVLGYENISANSTETVLGHHNIITTTLSPTDSPLLQVGNGTSSVRSNALTILNNGNIGTDLAITPTERLDIGSGSVRIRDINTHVGTDTDNMVVADANGVLKTVSKQTALLVGGDLSDALPTTTTITSSGGTLATAILGTYTFVITQKSLVTFSYDVSYTIDIATVNNGNSRFIGTYFQFTSKPATSTLVLNSPFVNVRTPFSTTTGGVPGFYFNSSSNRLLLEPGSYTVTLSGNFYSNGTVNFGGSTDHVTIVADPNF